MPRVARRRRVSSGESREPLHLVEDEARHEEIGPEDAGAREREQLAVHDDGRIDEQTVTRVERLRAHERSRRQTQHLEHLDALAPEDAKAEPAHDPREETRDRDRGPGREEERYRQHEEHGRGRAGDRAEGSGDDLRGRDRVDASLDDAERAVEEPAEHSPPT